MRVLTIVNALIWSATAWIGADLISGVVEQHAAGYPNKGQFTLYIRIPIAMAAGAIVVYALSRLPYAKYVALTLQVLILLALLPFLFVYGGGV